MLLKTPSKLRPSIGIVSRARSKTPSYTRPASQSPTIKRKSSPIVNKSYACYKEQKSSKHNRTSSLDRTREISSSIKSTKNKSLKSSVKVIGKTKESGYFDVANSEMNSGKYPKAVDLFTKALKKNPNNLEALYCRGVCYMHIGQNELAIKDFIVVMDNNPIFDKQLYMALYMCFTAINQQASAIRYLNKGLRKFPNFVQGFLLRGQIYLNVKKFEKALQDLKKVISMDKMQHNAVLLVAECYIGLKDYESAKKVINLALNRPEIIRKALKLKCKVAYETGKIEESLNDIENILNYWPDESIAYYYKGRINFDRNKYVDAALCFEQAIQSNQETDIISSSLYYLGLIKINERDFYGALHTLERSLKTGQSAELKALYKYTEGIISLMKRKLEEGISILTDIIKSPDKSLKGYIGDCYENRGFAYFSLKNYDSATEDFLAAKAYNKVSKATEFNIAVCDGILFSLQGNNIKALETFKSSREHFPKNIMPDIFRACLLLDLYINSPNDTNIIKKAESLVENVLDSREPDSEVIFYLSVLRFCLKNFELALEGAKKAIEKADENIAVHYLFRGYCHAMVKKYEESMQDFTIALQLNEDLKDAYIFRGISSFLQDDLQLALEDFLTVSKKFPDDNKLQYQIAKLLTVIGSYKESLKIFEIRMNSLDADKVICQAKNYLLLNEYEKALKCVKSYKSNSSADIDIIEFFINLKKDSSIIYKSYSLSETLKASEGVIFNKKYLYWFLGVLLLYNSDYPGATSYFQGVLEILHDQEPEVFADNISIEEENCEILYNLALCSLKSPSPDSKDHALMIFEELAEVLNEKHRGQLLFLSAVIELDRKNKSKAEKLLKEAAKCDPETLAPFLDNKVSTVLPLHTSNEISGLFPLIQIKIESLPAINIRPSIVLPNSEIDFELNDLIKKVQSFYSINTITPRPEAPWLLRVKGSIQFTEALLDISHDFETEAEEKTQKLSQTRLFVPRVSQSYDVMKKTSFFSEESYKNIDQVKENINEIIEKKIRNLC
jgi:tetratricopeptide (TPR) repeat protein